MEAKKTRIHFYTISTQETKDKFQKYVNIVNKEEGIEKNQFYNIMLESFSSEKALHNIIMKQKDNIGLKEAVSIAERITTSPDFQKLLEKHLKNL